MSGNKRHSRRGFTLVEMLVTVTVIGIIVAMALGALMNAQETAREQRTRSLISKLHTQIMFRWESYQTRRIPMLPIDLSKETPAVYATKRIQAQRELMRFELPQRYQDFVDDITVFPGNPAPLSLDPNDASKTLLAEYPALAEAYLRRYNDNKVNGVPFSPSAEFEAAECLYLVVTMGHDDSAGGQHLRQSDIGDVDQDGMEEFIDGWGRPISFIRWAPGYIPQLEALTDLQTGDPENDHDPFDPLRLDNAVAANPYRGARLVPLIYSSGGDGVSDIWAKNAITGPLLSDPYYQPAVGDGLLAGTPMTSTSTQDLPPDQQGEGRHTDNITNHALEVR